MKILLIDPGKELSKIALSAVVNQGIIKTETDFTNGYAELLSFAPDIVLLSACDAAHDFILKLREWSAVPIIVLSAHFSSSDVALHMNLGADQCALFSLSPVELTARINALIRFPRVFSDSEAPYTFGDISINFRSNEVTKNGSHISLTKTEFSVLKILCRNRGVVVPYDYILNQIWGPYASDNKILRVLSTSIRKKLEDTPSSPLFLQTVFGVGYKVP